MVSEPLFELDFNGKFLPHFCLHNSIDMTDHQFRLQDFPLKMNYCHEEENLSVKKSAN